MEGVCAWARGVVGGMMQGVSEALFRRRTWSIGRACTLDERRLMCLGAGAGARRVKDCRSRRWGSGCKARVVCVWGGGTRIASGDSHQNACGLGARAHQTSPEHDAAAAGRRRLLLVWGWRRR